ncbi:hypothetical protein [Mycobacterium deserti]|uniref:Uncharacterized protein n=1 Tax=Mycobacterium deserti TaxID=2978347 RepID=A0ABT2MCI7_9MYCO|nr:hypothetical protein [Mycobacterium deserti]MCT7659984.1 hypothetical protein [Mycobacterium deserti]
MTLQTDSGRLAWRRLLIGGLASGAVVAGLWSGAAAPVVYAQPDGSTAETEAPTAEADAQKRPCTGDDCKNAEESAPKVNADQVLNAIYSEYSVGDGGGQVSKLIDDAMKLRAQGFRPSNTNAVALKDALEYRPNQTPLVEALKATIAYQRKLQAQAAMSTAEGPVAGAVPKYTPPTGDISVPVAPGGDAGITIPIG